jgi:class 3 adenylate cyclase/tetratricopeptide (TPR) repeat protein
VSVCPKCGHENEAAAKFCSQCATPLVEVRGGTERKVVTVLFADLVGFTAKAERLDPEDVQAVLKPYHERLRYELERWGGTVEKFIGDAVMALFGAPVTREDDPERAVRAALAIRDWIAEEGELQVRIAVNTGEALVNLAARPEAGEGMAAGDVVNTAARLQSAAPVNGIIVGETTYRATAHTIDYRDRAPVEAKGKDAPIPVWEVAHAHARFGVDLAPQARTPLVGRDRELELLVTTLERAAQQRSPELITLVGVPGIGKSRLVGELFQHVERSGVLTYWRQGRSLPYGEAVSYWALGEMIKAQAGILETDTADEAEAKLAQAVEQLLDEDADWVLSHLRPLVGQAEAAPGSQEQAFAAWRRFFEALAEQHPLVLVFEDIQWADDGLLGFIEHLADWVHDTPLLILCTARRELLERRPGWGGGKVNAATIALAPLSDEETAKLIATLSETPLLEAEKQAALLERAGGNPLYAEQYVRMLAERESAEELPLPESVQGIIAARLDSLQPDEKALLQDSAVVGKVFWLGAVGATEQQLHVLQQKEFVQRARRSSVEGQTEYAFTHLLVRDVAYGQVPRAARAEKHVRVAGWIESLGRPEDQAEMLAHHYASALELARSAGQAVEELVPRARAALRLAGDRAAALNALPEAERYYRDALALTAREDPAFVELLFRRGRMLFLSGEEGEEELSEARELFLAAGERLRAAEAVIVLAQIAWNRGKAAEVAAHLADARSLVAGAESSATQAAVLAEISRYEMLADHNQASVKVGREALQMAEQLGLDETRARALINIGSARGAEGDAGGLADLEEAIRIAAEANVISELIRGHNNLASMNFVHGNVKEARAMFLETRRLALHYGQHAFALFVDGGPRISMDYSGGQWDKALELAGEYLAWVESAASTHYQAASAYGVRAMLRLGRGGDAGALADAEQAVERARPVGDPQLTQTTFPHAATVFLSLGDERRARMTLDEALAGLRDLPDQLGYAVTEFHLVVWLAQQLGREVDAAKVLDQQRNELPWNLVSRAVQAREFREAADLLAALDMPTHEAFYRLRAAEVLAAEGRRAEADEQLHAALAFYRGVGATRYVREGESLLAASA